MAENGKQRNYPNQKSAQGCCGQNQGGCEAHRAPNQELLNAPVLGSHSWSQSAWLVYKARPAPSVAAAAAAAAAGFGGLFCFVFFWNCTNFVRACLGLVVEKGWEGRKGKKATALHSITHL